MPLFEARNGVRVEIRRGASAHDPKSHSIFERIMRQIKASSGAEALAKPVSNHHRNERNCKKRQRSCTLPCEFWES
jgi:hypothetical protein